MPAGEPMAKPHDRRAGGPERGGAPGAWGGEAGPPCTNHHRRGAVRWSIDLPARAKHTSSMASVSCL